MHEDVGQYAAFITDLKAALNEAVAAIADREAELADAIACQDQLRRQLRKLVDAVNVYFDVDYGMEGTAAIHLKEARDNAQASL